MPRYGFEQREDRAKAGAATQARIYGNVVEREQLELAKEREARMAEGQALNNEVERWKFEKMKTLDRNAAAMTIATEKQTIAANEDLFKIDTAAPDADLKLAEWGAKYYRVLDQDTGDPRLIRQFEINQKRVEKHQALSSRAQELRDKREESIGAWEVANGIEHPRKQDGSPDYVAAGKLMREAAKGRGLAERTAVSGNVTFEAPKPELATVTEVTESKDTPLDLDKPETTSRRTVSRQQPVEELKQPAPLSGRAFLDTLKR